MVTQVDAIAAIGDPVLRNHRITQCYHELSHAVVARAVGVRVRDIVVHPLGGMTRLDWTARDPRKEALISSAGPAINLVIALLLWGVLHNVGVQGRLLDWVLAPLLLANLWLGALNLIPAFPMDGGRILRALLSVRFGHLPATRLAARIGRWIAGLALLAPLLAPTFGWTFWQAAVFPVLGLFVFILGEIELKQAEAVELMNRMRPFMGTMGDRTPKEGDVIDVQASSRVVEDDR